MRRKHAISWSKLSKKRPKHAFLPLFLSKFAAVQKNFQKGSLLCSGSARHFSRKVLKNAFFCFFFKNLHAVQKIWSNYGLYSDLGDLSSKNQFGRPEKRSKFSKLF